MSDALMAFVAVGPALGFVIGVLWRQRCVKRLEHEIKQQKREHGLQMRIWQRSHERRGM